MRQFVCLMDKEPHLAALIKNLVIELALVADTRSDFPLPDEETLVRVVKSLRSVKHVEVDEVGMISIFLSQDVAQTLSCLEHLHLDGRLSCMHDPFDLSGHSALDGYSSLRTLSIGDLLNANTADLLSTPSPRLPLALSQLTKIHLLGNLGDSPYLPPLLAALRPSTTTIEFSSLSYSAHFPSTLSHLRHPSAVRYLFLEQLLDNAEEITDVGTALSSFVNLEYLRLYGWFTLDPSTAATLATSTSLRRLSLVILPSSKALLRLLEHPQRRSTLRLIEIHTGRAPPCDPTFDELSTLLSHGSSTLPKSKLLFLAFPSLFWDEERSPQGVLDILAAAKRVAVVVRGGMFDAMGDEAQVEKRIAIVRSKLRELENDLDGLAKGQNAAKGEEA